MGEGIDAAVAGGTEFDTKAMENLRDQVLLALVVRLGHRVDLTMDEINATGGLVLMMGVNQETGVFRFEVEKKH